MSVDQLLGKYKRLKGELAQAYGEAAWNSARVDRLADEIAALEHEIARVAPGAVRNRTAATPASGAPDRQVSGARSSS